MEPHGRGFGCWRVKPELVCILPILTTFEWDGGSRVHTRLPGLRQGTTVCVHMRMDMEQQSDHKLMTPSGTGLLVCGILLSPWCGKKDVPKGVNLNRYAGPGSHVRWHSDNEPLFGPQYSPKIIVSLSSGNSVEFKVRRRAPGEVPSSIRLDHGDVLGCSCPIGVRGVVGCVLPTCAQGLVEPGSRCLGEGENKWSSSWGLVFLLLILVIALLVSTWIHSRRRHRHSGQRPSRSAAYFSSRGRAHWVGDGVGDCHDVAKLPRVCLFISLVYLFWGTCCTLFSRV